MKYQSNDQYLLYTRHEDLEQASQKNFRAEIPCWTIFQIHHMWDYKAIYLPSIMTDCRPNLQPSADSKYG